MLHNSVNKFYKNRPFRLSISLLFIAAMVIGAVWFVNRSSKPQHTAKKQTLTQISPADTPQSPSPVPSNIPSATPVSFNKNRYSLTDSSSIWVIANKHNPLQPKDYAPTDLETPNIDVRVVGDPTMQLRQVAAKALENLAAGAAKDNLSIMLSSGYRSYNFQTSLYSGYVSSQGQSVADTQSARPGYSEHQTGLSADVAGSNRTCVVEACFANTPEGKWLAANAYKYGFVIRYPDGKQPITGYVYEPWHIRYVGVELANEMHDKNILTLEEFFGLPAAPDYY